MSVNQPHVTTVRLGITSLFLIGMLLLVTIIHPGTAQSFPGGQQLTHDVAITDVQSTATSVNRGDSVEVDVTLANLGTSSEAVTIILKDETDGREADQVGAGLEPGQILVLTLQWDTSGASEGAHGLRATAELVGDENPNNNALGPALPIEVIFAEILLGDGSGGELPAASFGGGLNLPDASTAATLSNQVFLGNHDASWSSSLNLVAVGTQPARLESFFLANTDAEFSPEFPLRNPFLQGQLRGLTHLQGRPSGWGVLVQVGDVVHPVDGNGKFNLLLPEGFYVVSIWAPGYVAVNLPRVEIVSGQALIVPELTLPFGDANGDGRIDIQDLGMAAGNFGTTVQELELP